MGYWSNLTRAVRGKATTFSAETIAALLGEAANRPLGSIGESYEQLATYGFMRNVFAYRAIVDIARGAASVELNIHRGDDEAPDHELAKFLQRPNQENAWPMFMQMMVSYYMLDGNSFLYLEESAGRKPLTMRNWRPDKVEVNRGRNDVLQPTIEYIYRPGSAAPPTTVVVSSEDEFPPVLHLKTFHPTDSERGLAPMRVGRIPVERHNLVDNWNSNLLRNAAKPSGVLSVAAGKETVGGLTDDEREAVKTEIENFFSGPNSAGRPAVLEGGMTWQRTGLTPMEMDWSHSKETAARDVGTALGYPSFLFGIPGDNTYSNQREARLALWEDTIIPLVTLVISELTEWLAPRYGQDGLVIKPNFDSIAALTLQRERVWERVRNASWLTPNEQRSETGFDQREEEEADELYIAAGQVPLSLGPVPSDTGPSDEPAEVSTSARRGEAQPGEAVDKNVVLNGAQVASLLAILAGVSAGPLTKATASKILQAAFGMSDVQAGSILADVVEGDAPAAGPPPSFGDNSKGDMVAWLTKDGWSRENALALADEAFGGYSNGADS